MPQYILTSRNSIPLSGGRVIEKGRTVLVNVNTDINCASNIFTHSQAKKDVAAAFAMNNIPPIDSFMNNSKWDVKPFNPRF